VELRQEGSFTVPQGRAAVVRRLEDVGFVARCLPDLVGYEPVEANAARVRLRVGLSHVRGELEAVVRTQAVGEEGVRVEAQANGLGSRVALAVTATVTGDDVAATVAWRSEVSVMGLLASVGGAVLRQVSSQNVARTVERLREELARDPAPPWEG
jgi:carbon monoxide dehydrogenase subunit G